jgi:uncharacterized DUF497 family protein
MSDSNEYEWDESKRRSNIIKHRIDFEDAKEVFIDPAAYTYYSAKEIDEQRYVTVGSMKGVLVAVVSTRRGASIRIISARVARRIERQAYGSESTKARP